MSVQSDSSELVGGFKPVDLRHIVLPIYQLFIDLFTASFCRAGGGSSGGESQNNSYLKVIRKAFEKQDWKKLVKGFNKAASRWYAKEAAENKREEEDEDEEGEDTGAAKPSSKRHRASLESKHRVSLSSQWAAFASSVATFEKQRQV